MPRCLADPVAFKALRIQKDVIFPCPKKVLKLPILQVSAIMCWACVYQYPVCDCIYVSDAVIRCSLFLLHADKTKDKTVFRPKLITARCQGLNLFFNGVDYVSIESENEGIIVPTGLDCPDVELHEMEEDEEEVRWCALCDSETAIRFIRLRVEYTFDKAALARLLEEEAVRPSAADAKAQAAGKGVESPAAESADTSGSSSTQKGRTREPSLLQYMVANRMLRAAEERAGLVIDLDGEGNWLGSKNR